MRVNLLYIITSISVGGVEMMLYKLLSRIDRERFNPTIISLIDDRDSLAEQIEALGIPVYTIGMQRGLPTPQAIWRLLWMVRKLKPDLIQGRMYHGNLAAQLIALLSFQKIPVLWSIHHSINALESEKKMTQAIIRFGAYISPLADQIIFVSQNSKFQHEALGYCRDKSCFIPNGCDTALFQPSIAARSSIRAELGLSDNAFLIGLIARYHPLKDHANFLRAAAVLHQECPDAHFVLAGAEVDTENHTLNQLIHQLKLESRVHLLGHRRDLPRLMAALDIITLSSQSEAFPNVLIEAMACGVPCVSTDVGDAALIVAETGRIVRPRDAEALASAWKELIVLDGKEREDLGKAARSRVIKLFSLDAVVIQNEQIYERVLASKTPPRGTTHVWHHWFLEPK